MFLTLPEIPPTRTNPSHRLTRRLANPKPTPPTGVRNALPTEKTHKQTPPPVCAMPCQPKTHKQTTPTPVCAMPCQPKTHKQTPPHRCAQCLANRKPTSNPPPTGVVWQHVLDPKCPVEIPLATRSRPQLSCGNPLGNTFRPNAPCVHAPFSCASHAPCPIHTLLRQSSR